MLLRPRLGRKRRHRKGDVARAGINQYLLAGTLSMIDLLSSFSLMKLMASNEGETSL
jgi:hypothetical protein